jgi:prolyl-tRNA synthetase
MNETSQSSDAPERITPREKDFPAWYQDVIAAGQLAESAPVRGCFILRPNGYAVWEAIQAQLDPRFKAVGVRNAYFPLFIPNSFIEREAETVAGFSPELAVVTHAGGEELEEPLVVRPTSETVIWATYKRWIHSHRDLPLLLNQWANVVRWEKRPRAFLRTSEFLWQEGHTAHATAEDARAFALLILGIYTKFADEVLALAPLPGEKPPHERFPGATSTFTMEPMMQDGRALQAGTSHDLGTTFGEAFDVMVPGDDTGVVFPPLVAADQVVIVPIGGRDQSAVPALLQRAHAVQDELVQAGLRVAFDDRLDQRLGARLFAWERRGVPLRLELGQRELDAGNVLAVTRHDGQKRPLALDRLTASVQQLLAEMQIDMGRRAREFRESRTVAVEDRAELEAAVAQGYALARWCESVECAKEIQEATRATVRCFPFERKDGGFAPLPDDPGPCAYCGGPARRRAIIARAY